MQRNNVYRLDVSKWYINRVVYLIGGLFVLFSALLVSMVSVWWICFTFFVGLMLINFALTGYCPLAIMLAKMGVSKD